MIIVRIYVDDLVVTKTSTNIVSKFKQAMATEFDMNNLGILTYYLGIEVYWRKKYIIITQEGYIKKVLTDGCIYDCNYTLVPMDWNVIFSKGDGEEDINVAKYRNLVGRLRQFLQRRPDLPYAVDITSRWYMQTL